MTDSAYQHEDRPPSHAPFAVLMLTASVGNRTKAEQRAATGPAKQIPMGRFANFALAVRPELWGDAMDWLLGRAASPTCMRLLESTRRKATQKATKRRHCALRKNRMWARPPHSRRITRLTFNGETARWRF